MVFDIVLLISILGSFWYGLQKGNVRAFYILLKLFVLFALSSKYAYFTGATLTQWHLLAPMSVGVLLLLGFAFNFGVLWMVALGLEKMFQKKKTSQITTFQRMLKGVWVVLQINVTVTFAFFVILQFPYPKPWIYAHLKNSFFYPKVEKFYLRLFSPTFVKSVVMGSDTGTNQKELIFKSLTHAVK
jgi:hypothetical protein